MKRTKSFAQGKAKNQIDRTGKFRYNGEECKKGQKSNRTCRPPDSPMDPERRRAPRFFSYGSRGKTGFCLSRTFFAARFSVSPTLQGGRRLPAALKPATRPPSSRSSREPNLPAMKEQAPMPLRRPLPGKPPYGRQGACPFHTEGRRARTNAPRF